MKQEYWLGLVVGLFIFAFVIDSIVSPLQTGVLPTPYHFLNPEIFAVFPLTTASIIIKAVAILITPIFLLSFAGWAKLVKGITIFIVSGVLQLYALQDIATGTGSIPPEWAISFALGGLFLLIPALIYILIGVIEKTNVAMNGEESDDYIVKPKEEKKE